MYYVYVYGIINGPRRVRLAQKGMGGQDVFNIAYGRISALVSIADKNRFEPNEKNVLTHEAVIEEMMNNNHAVLPVRFATVLNDKREIKEILRKHYQEFVANLKKVKGAVELGVKVFWEADKMKKKAEVVVNKRIKQVPMLHRDAAVNRPRVAGSGSRYLLEKMKIYFLEEGLEQKAEKMAKAINQRLSRHVRDSRFKKLVTEGLALNASYLVPKENCQDFENEVAKMQKENKNLKFLFSGPWPPYNFIEVKVAQ